MNRPAPVAGFIMKNYLVVFTLFVVLICAGTYFFSASSGQELMNIRWGLIAYFVLMTFGFHAGLEAASKGKPAVFIRYYMGATSFKLLIHLGVILAFAFSYKQFAVPFIISFIVYYMLFMVFEVGMNWQKFRAK